MKACFQTARLKTALSLESSNAAWRLRSMRRDYLLRRAVAIGTVSVMSVGMLAGCGSSSTDTASSDTAETTEAASADTEGTADSADAQTIIVATGQAWAPYCYRDDSGELTGYDVELLRAVDDYLTDYTFDIQGMDFSTCIVSIDSGACDMVSYQLVQSDARKEKYIFSDDPYCLSPLALCTKKDSGISSFDDMKGKTIYSDPSTFEYSLLTEYNEAHPDTVFTIQSISDMSQADEYKGVSNGSVDASLTYETAFAETIPEIGVDNLQLSEAVIIEESYYMIRPELTDFRDAVSEALKALQADGTIKSLNEQYFGDDYFTKYADLINYDASTETSVE